MRFGVRDCVRVESSRVESDRIEVWVRNAMQVENGWRLGERNEKKKKKQKSRDLERLREINHRLGLGLDGVLKEPHLV